MYSEAGRYWSVAHNNYDLAHEACQREALQVGLSYLGEAIVYMERALHLGQPTFPVTILMESKQLLEAWYEQFFWLFVMLIDA